MFYHEGDVALRNFLVVRNNRCGAELIYQTKNNPSKIK